LLRDAPMRLGADERNSGPPILIIEDEPALSESLDYALTREGFRVVLASDGVSGLERFRTERPGLILLDLMLPTLPGLDVCRIIRAQSNVPIVILTAKDSEADKVAGPRDRSRRLRHQAFLNARARVTAAGTPSPGGDECRQTGRRRC
jgi:CheY-like chemotaxis protein